jgi:hypothetical protein
MTIDPAMRAAYVDGELDEIARRRVERAMADDPALAEAVARERRLRETLHARFDPYAEEPVPERFRALIEPKVVPIEHARRERPRRWMQTAAIAAALVVGVAVGRQVGTNGPVASENGTLVADGALAHALDTQLASAQPSDAPVRIGLTFRAKQGPVCRTFASAELQGIACREHGDWALVRTAAGERQAPYRQASSGDIALLTAAQAMMAGAPFDRAAERAARDQGWE